jgi:CheY-like chemotaxis protein
MAGKKLKILMVEDEPDIVEIYGSQLKSAGYALEVAKNGQEALVWLEKNTPDLVLLDLLMPDMNGFEFLDRIKKFPKRKGIYIYAWSNLTQKKDVELAKQKGIDGFLIKSDYTPKKLAEKVAEILKKIIK